MRRFAVIKRLLKPGGRLVVGDILRPEVGMARDVLALLRFALNHGFLKDALIGLVSHRAVGLPAIAHQGRAAALQRSRDDRRSWRPPDLPPRARHSNIGHNPWRMTFVARHAF